MALSAYFVEDPITRIVSITLTLGGGTFVVKTTDTEILYGQAHGSAEQSANWLQWSETWDLFGGAIANSGSSSALIKTHDADPGKAVWVLSSLKENEDGDEGSVIIYSEDGGATWELVYQQYEQFGDDRVPWIYEPTGIVWDTEQKAFFASFYFADWHFDGEDIIITDGEEIQKSTDGRSWSRVSRNAHLTGVTDTTTPSDLSAYCNKPENQNRSGGSQKIADGLQGFNPNTGTFVQPTALIGFDPWNGAAYAPGKVPSVTRIDDKGITTIQSVDVVNCYAVTFYNGVWIAVGGDDPSGGAPPIPGGTYIAASFDDGKTWARIFQGLSTRAGVTVSGQGAFPT